MTVGGGDFTVKNDGTISSSALAGPDERILVTDASGNISTGLATSLLKDIYNFDGSLSSARTVTMNDKSLQFVSTTGNISMVGSGNLGIGTSLPLYKEHLLYSSSTDGLLIQNTIGGGVGSANIYMTGYADITQGVSHPAVCISAIDDGSYSANLIFSTKTPGADDNNLTERMRLDHIGNVGLGTTTTNARLNVDGGTNVSLSTAGSGYVCIGNATGTNIALDNSSIQARNNTSAYTLLMQNQGGNLQIHSGVNNNQTVFFDDGTVGIGTSTPNDKLEVSDYIRARGYRCRRGIDPNNQFGGNLYNFYWTGTQLETWVDGVNLGVTSDRRLKENIINMDTTALQRIMQLRPVSFYYKNIKGTIFTGSTVQQEGFIADELQQVIPSAVNGKKDAVTADGGIQPQTLNITPVVSVLAKAVQEQQTEIETQKKLINAQNDRIARLELLLQHK